MAKRKRHARQTTVWIAATDLPTTAAHSFYDRLNRILDEAGFDAYVERLCAPFYAPTMGRPSLARGRHVLAEPAPDVLLMDFAPSSISLRVRWWIAPPKRAEALDARDKVLTAVKNQLTSHRIDLPFPTQQILFHDQTEDSDGERARQREGWPAGNTDMPASRKVADAIRHMSGSKPRGAEGE